MQHCNILPIAVTLTLFLHWVTQISQRKQLFYNLCKRIQSRCVQATDASPFIAEEALNDAIMGLVAHIQSIPKMTLGKFLKLGVLGQPTVYEKDVLHWEPDSRMADGNPVVHRKRLTPSTQA